jgi:hypothetical protein
MSTNQPPIFSYANFTREVAFVTQEIVAPEPHFRGNRDIGWEHLPRRVQVVLTIVAILAMILVLFLTG